MEEAYEVVRQDFLGGMEEPQLSFARGRVYVNSYCLTMYPDDDYVIFMVDRNQKTLAVKPYKTKVKDSLRWCTGGRKRRPRKVSCKPFFYMLFKMMGWDLAGRYRITGIRQRSASEDVLFFDLKEAMAFERTDEFDEVGRRALSTYYPDAWKESFGVPKKDYKPEEIMERYDKDELFRIELKQADAIANRGTGKEEAAGDGQSEGV